MQNPLYEDRKYQARAVEEARRLMRRGVKRFIFQSPTGSGKSILAGMLLKTAAEKGKPSLFAAHRRELILEPRRKFIEQMGIDPSLIGVIKAGEAPELRNKSALIQIVSIQSVYGRVLPPAELVIIDECHLARSKSYEWLVKQYPDAWIIGLTATPGRTDRLPLGDVFEEIIPVELMENLFRAGYIVMPRIFTVPNDQLPDVTGVKTRGGDYAQEELGQRVMARKVMGSIPGHWHKRAAGLRTMLFAVHKEHSRALVDLLVGEGIRARHVDGQSTKTDRDKALEDLKRGEIDILCQVGLWIEGLDMPELKCAIMARPTQSLIVHYQTCGRIERPWEGVTPVLLDHAGNCRLPENGGLGLPTMDRPWRLFPEEKETGGTGRTAADLVRNCPCGEVLHLSVTICPSCGQEFKSREVGHVEGELVEVTPAAKTSDAEKFTLYNRLWQIAYRDGYDEAWVLRRFAERFNDGPPREWKQPERVPIVYTEEDKREALRTFRLIAHRNGYALSWVEKRYEAKFGEVIEHLYAGREKSAVTPQEKVKVEF